MADKCEMFMQCGFFKKYQDTKDLACRGFITLYCEGPKRESCKRLEYRKEHNAPPPDDMMPNGLNVPV